MTILDPSAPAVGHHRPPGRPAPPARPLAFGTTVLLSKAEVFGACQALADADRLLLRCGASQEAAALGDLFELLEHRLAQTPTIQVSGPASAPSSGR